MGDTVSSRNERALRRRWRPGGRTSGWFEREMILETATPKDGYGIQDSI
jgi:hypothetical protein